MFNRDGSQLSARHRDWSERLVAAGYAVLMLDSFTARGIKELCTQKDRPITPQDRAGDVRAALAWLATQASVDAQRLALIGWSHGGSTVLRTLRPGFLDNAPKLTLAIAFYPGCTPTAREAGWVPSVPLSILIGAADDWTPPEPCRELAQRHTSIRYIEYPDAYHGFDEPGRPVRVRTDVALRPGGKAHTGTNPAARAAAIPEVMGALAKAFAAKPR